MNILRHLCIAAGVAVFHAQKRVQSLEQMFLEATGGETVD